MDTSRNRAQTPAPDAGDDDVRTSPWTYPGLPAAHSGRLLDGHLHELPDRHVRRLAAERHDGSAPVVAVGCNASPRVLGRKLRERGVSDDVVVLTATLHGVAVGHSAHISAPGYVAATPYADPDARTRVVALLLEAGQRRCLDATEPNYHRRTLAGRFALQLDVGGRVDELVLYDSVWGVLAPPGRAPVPLTRQQALHRYLHTHCPAYADAVPTSDDVAETMARLSADADLRRRIRDALRSTGWARPSGLGPDPVRRS